MSLSKLLQVKTFRVWGGWSTCSDAMQHRRNEIMGVGLTNACFYIPYNVAHIFLLDPPCLISSQVRPTSDIQFRPSVLKPADNLTSLSGLFSMSLNCSWAREDASTLHSNLHVYQVSIYNNAVQRERESMFKPRAVWNVKCAMSAPHHCWAVGSAAEPGQSLWQ